MNANQEKTEGTEAMHMLATLQCQASKVLHEAPKGEMYEEIIREMMTDLGTSTWPQGAAFN
jgi:hypothetical protein